MKPKYYNSIYFLLLITAVINSGLTLAAETNYEKARWHPIHFKPAIDKATNEQCLECHQEVIERKVRKESPAGVKASEVMAWYQTLDTYSGEQETFHRRHLTTPLANELMNLQCNTCHQGNDPREEAIIPPDHSNQNFTLRKSVNPKICLMCHGRTGYEMMGLPSPWATSASIFQNNCLLCHVSIRTNRHRVNFLKADAIEKAGKNNSDVCYGCHGGRQWYRIAFPYPRNEWPGMSSVTPEWAKERPTQSEARFKTNNASSGK
ncbi:MAG: hypothetical protein RPU15_06010 [Candidatus Sedimenticola sp. (ex Thyasira tokunagai)]